MYATINLLEALATLAAFCAAVLCLFAYMAWRHKKDTERIFRDPIEHTEFDDWYLNSRN